MTPHPSLVPLDMAAAGLVTITNTFANKTAEKMGQISHNILAVSPTIEDIRGGLAAGIQRIEDIEGRVAGSQLNWASTWDETFGEAMMSKVSAWLHEYA